MVLGHKVGKERSFGVVVLLFIVTFGIYGIYWHYKAHAEVYKQFELDREGRNEGIIWLILGYVLFQPLLWVYQYMFVNNVNYVRERLGMKKRLSSGGFLGLTIPGTILFVVGLILMVMGIIFLAAKAGDSGGGPQDPPLTAEEAEKLNDAGGVMAPIGAVVMLGGLAMSLIAYGRLQGSINGVWKGFDKRMAQLTGPPQAPPAWNLGAGAPVPPPVGAAGPAPPAPRPPARPPSP